MTLRVLIADDEPPALAKLRRLCEDTPGLVVVGEAADGEGALARALAERPALALLDVQMPRLSGIEVAQRIAAHTLSILVTAHDVHAVRAFEIGAIDYLLKPYTRERFAAALARARTRLAAEPPGSRTRRLATGLGPLRTGPDTWLVRLRDGYRPVHLDDVLWVSADDNYIHLHTAAGAFMERATLAEFLEADLAGRFVRVHRSHALALAALRRVQPIDKGDQLAVMADGTELRVSRRHRAELLARLAR